MRLLFSLTLCAAPSLLAGAYFRDSFHEDGPAHFLLAREAWTHPALFFDVWARPLYMLSYAPVSLLGRTAAGFLSLLLALWAALQTARLARLWGWRNPEWGPLVLFSQPAFFFLTFDTLTEPLFAALLATALHRLYAGARKSSCLLLSLLPLSRPEGALCAAAAMAAFSVRRCWSAIPFLMAAPMVWWAAAWATTGDPLHVARTWPAHWRPDGPYSPTPVGRYLLWSLLICGPWLPFLLIGMARLRMEHRRLPSLIVAAAFLFYFAAGFTGAVGNVGHVRFMATVAPLTALLCLRGWNELAPRIRRVLGPVLIPFAFAVAVVALDAHRHVHDFRAFDPFPPEAAEAPRVLFSHACGYVLSGRSFSERYSGSLEDLPPGTLAVWEDGQGQRLYGITSSDFRSARWTLLRSEQFQHERFPPTRALLPASIAGPRSFRLDLWRKTASSDRR